MQFELNTHTHTHTTQFILYRNRKSREKSVGILLFKHTIIIEIKEHLQFSVYFFAAAVDATEVVVVVVVVVFQFFHCLVYFVFALCRLAFMCLYIGFVLNISTVSGCN